VCPEQARLELVRPGQAQRQRVPPLLARSEMMPPVWRAPQPRVARLALQE